MLVYRITTAKWATALTGSGRAARWNSNGYFVVYTASTRALACLENIVHRKNIGKNELFKVTVIEIPAAVKIEEIKTENLQKNWTDYLNYAACQSIGDEWIRKGKTAVLKMPSAIIPEEFNFLLNPQHIQFSKISIVQVEAFRFDERLQN